eukprot:CAMPEP_0176322010 /NCGR_PEP_ID=MMETSP0121_2-20121125/71643_1 /TAXON_ID=160619 /ORGANISM="Kryptoperidinium foliaceum, Strain CCMP 1326" /LENGTH=256 /DNA_ID=CAMNT_0017664469 /DNA_START=154 /DNA_END=924 /DNA_ORIENTATION=-
MPATHAVMKHATQPLIIARTTQPATSSLRSGAKAFKAAELHADGADVRKATERVGRDNLASPGQHAFVDEVRQPPVCDELVDECLLAQKSATRKQSSGGTPIMKANGQNKYETTNSMLKPSMSTILPAAATALLSKLQMDRNAISAAATDGSDRPARSGIEDAAIAPSLRGLRNALDVLELDPHLLRLRKAQLRHSQRCRARHHRRRDQVLSGHTEADVRPHDAARDRSEVAGQQGVQLSHCQVRKEWLHEQRSVP